MKIQNVKYMLMAQEMERAVAFWEGMGFPRRFVSEHWSELDASGATLALHGGHDGSRNPTGFGIQVEDIAEGFQHAVGLGATVEREPERREIEGLWLADLVDPECNTFTLSQYGG